MANNNDSRNAWNHVNDVIRQNGGGGLIKVKCPRCGKVRELLGRNAKARCDCGYTLTYENRI